MGGRTLCTAKQLNAALSGRTIESVGVEEYEADPEADAAAGASIGSLWLKGGGRIVLHVVELTGDYAIQATYYTTRRKAEGRAS